jgi:hypothetical protein
MLSTVGRSGKGGSNVMEEDLSADIFMPHIGKPVVLPEGHRLTLVAVDRRGPSAPGAPRAAFTLILRGVPSPIVPEGMHRLTLEDGASVDLYLIPIHTPSRDRQDYQIVFN